MPVQSTAPITAFIGTDDLEVKRLAGDLAKKLGAERDFGADIIDGHAENAEDAASRIHQVVDALNTFAFFGGQKLVWLKNANFLGDDRTSSAEATLAALEKLTDALKGGMPSGTHFLLSANGMDKRRSFYKTLLKIGTVTAIDRIDNTQRDWEQKAEMLVREVAESCGMSFAPGALELFTLFTGGDRRVIENEIEKLLLYLGKKRKNITESDVRLMTPLSRAGVIFELGNALASRQLKRALELLRQLLFQGETEIAILLATVVPTVRNLLLAKDLLAHHKSLKPPTNPFYFGKDLERLSEAATAHLPRTKEGKLNAYALGIAATHARRYSLPELMAALQACMDANVAMISTPTEKEIILTKLLVRIIGGAKTSYAA